MRSSRLLRWIGIGRPTWFDLMFGAQMLFIGLIYSQTFDLMPVARNPLLYGALLINLGCYGMCAIRNMRAFIAMTLVLAIFLLFLLTFAIHFGTPISFTMIGAYSGPFAVGLFGICAQRMSLDRMLRILFLASCAYLPIYFYFHFTIDTAALIRAAQLGKEASRGIILAHGTTSSLSSDATFRITMASLNVCFGLLYALAQFRATLRWHWLIPAALFGYCIVIGDFRFFLFAVTFSTLVMLFPANPSLKIGLTLASTGAAMFVILLLSHLSINYYDSFRGDPTGLVRAQEADRAIGAIQDYPAFGTGLYSQFADLSLAYGGFPMALSDIGYLGELVQFGAFGFVLLFLSNLTVAQFTNRAQRHPEVTPASARALLGLYVFVTVMEMTSTFLWEEAGAVMLACAIGYAARIGFGRRIVWRRKPAVVAARHPAALRTGET